MCLVMWKFLCLGLLIAGGWHSIQAANSSEAVAPITSVEVHQEGFTQALSVVVTTLANTSGPESQPAVAASSAASVAALVSAWATCEDAIRSSDRSAYAAIEEALGDLQYSVQPDSVDLEAARAATVRLSSLTATWKSSATPAAPVHAPGPEATSVRTLAEVQALVVTARSRLAEGNPGDASSALAEARRCWPDVEGAVKTRNLAAYTRIEELFAQASSQLKAKHDATDSSLALLAATMAPYTTASSYGVMDAFLILLREGIEALFVISALLAYLGRSGHAAQQRIIWWGAGAGVIVSLVLAVIIHLVFRATFSGAHREAVEGFIGLAAAGLLFWVSWWLHRATSISRWNAFIANRTSAALASGSVWSLGTLAFLAVVREGAETALFYLGMAPSIATGDLFLGIGLGGVVLVVVGVAIIQLGARLPIRPLFAALGILLLAMGIKFIGAGVHALQIAGLTPASFISGLPTIDLLGFFPTWETVLAQGLVLVAVVSVLFVSRLGRSPQIKKIPS